jgi:4-hydroxy 2-oxovalerate aldolase
LRITPCFFNTVVLVRCATYVKDLAKAIHIVNDARAKGYDTAINIMSISTVPQRELEACLLRIREETHVKVGYIVDSFGSLHLRDIDHLVSTYRNLLPGIEVGIHAHNNQQLAFANTLQGLNCGASYLDATIYGLGRGAGNCNLELLLSCLKLQSRFDLRPIFDVIASHLLPLQKEIPWGYSVPYLVLGMLNRHPDEAIRLMTLAETDPCKYDFRSFYDRISGRSTDTISDVN